MENKATGRMVYRMFFPGRNFLTGRLCTLKPPQNLKPKTYQTFPKKPTFFQPWVQACMNPGVFV